MKIAILHQQFANFLSRVLLEKDVIWNDYRSSSARFQNCHHMLDEVELFVRRAYGEVVPNGRLSGSFVPKGGLVITTS